MTTYRTMFSGWTKAFIALTVPLLLAAGGMIFNFQDETIRREVENNLRAVAQLKVDQIADWQHDQLEDARLIAQNHFLLHGVKEYLANPTDETASAVRMIFNQARLEHNYADIVLLDRQGVVKLTLDASSSDNYAAELRAWADHPAALSPALMELHTDPGGNLLHIGVVAPLFPSSRSADEPMGGIILLSDATGFLLPLIKTWPTPSKSAETLMVLRDDSLPHYLLTLRHKVMPDRPVPITLDRPDDPAVKAVMGKTGFAEGIDYRGIKVVSFILPIPESHAFLVAKIDKEEAFADLHLRSAFLLAFLLVLLALVGGAGMILWQRDKKAHYRMLYQAESRLRATVERHSIILGAINDAVIATDVNGMVDLVNPAAEALTGWTEKEARGRPITDIFRVTDETTGSSLEDPVGKILSGGPQPHLVEHGLLLARDKTELPVAGSGAPIYNYESDLTGVALVFRNQRSERLTWRLIQVRLALIEYAASHPLDELLTKTLDEICLLVDSPIGFYHFVDRDQQTLSLQQWSTRTRQEFCRAEGEGLHYPIAQAGVWVDCVREKKPVIHNDYLSLSHKKGLPEGHAPVLRELVVPVMRNQKVVAILGVGNKAADYTEQDVEIVSYLADVSWEIIRRKQTENRLRNLSGIVEQSTEGMAIAGIDGTLTYVNDAWAAMHGFTDPDELVGKNLALFHTDEQMKNDVRPFNKIVMKEGSWSGEVGHVTREGKQFPTLMTTILLKNGESRPIAMAAIARDVSEVKNLQAQLYQAQKMESVGKLAGGIAHDFNNMLSVILGYTELALDKVDPDGPLHDDLEEIIKAAKRSASITRQLLAFARKQTIAPKLLDLNETVEGMLKMLRRLIGEDIDLAWLPGSGMKPVKMDPAQLDQVLANLCVNAREAIAGVGSITIETEMRTFDREYCDDHPGFFEGEFVQLAVSDDGCGMDKEILGKLFEPFFTTREAGKGTGLGLATVYGIVKQNNGFINVYSEPGKGATFKIYLPARPLVAEAGEEKAEEKIHAGHGETLLLVEDEPAIMALGRRMLEQHGYTVLTAGTPGEALRLADDHDGDIALLITDVVMPKMNGRELAKQLYALHPGIKTLFMSGYTANAIAHRGILDDAVNFLPKPFSAIELTRKVKEVLDHEQPRGQDS